MNKKSTALESRAQRNKRMVSEMSNAKTLWWVGVALLVHAAIILGTSREYIRVHWFHGTPSEVAGGDEVAAPVAAAQAPAATATPAEMTVKPAAPAQATAGLSDDDKKLAERSNSPMVKSITDTAKPAELPKVNPLELNDKP
jgi:hypothetical protein